MTEEQKFEEFVDIDEQEMMGEDIPDFDDIPDLEEAMQQAEKFNVVDDEKPAKTSVKVGFIGAGQAGCNIADSFWSLGYRRVLAINTAEQDMQSLTIKRDNCYVLEGYNGAGKNPIIGQKAIQEHYEDVLRRMHLCLGKNVEHIIICAGLGGGTGTGSASTLINICLDYFKELGREPKIGMIGTIPEKTEKGSIQKNAQIALNNMRVKCEQKVLSPLIVIDNGQIARFFPGEPIASFYPKSNKIVTGIFDRFNTVTAYGSPIGHNVDKADLQSLLGGGLMTYGQCRVKDIINDSTLAEAMIKNIKNTLLCPSFNLEETTNACCLIVADEKQLQKITKDAVNKSIEALTRLFEDKEVKIHFGIYKSPRAGVHICTAVSGIKQEEKE